MRSEVCCDRSANRSPSERSVRGASMRLLLAGNASARLDVSSGRRSRDNRTDLVLRRLTERRITVRERAAAAVLATRTLQEPRHADAQEERAPDERGRVTAGGGGA